MTAKANLLEHLQEAGYEPDEDGDWFDLIVSGIGAVRVASNIRRDGGTEVYMYDRNFSCVWQASFSFPTPAAVILAVIIAAEAELAEL